MASKKVRITGGVAAVVILAGVVAFSVPHRPGKVPVQIQKVGRRDLVSVVSASGEVKPKKFVNVSANVSGRITQLLVKEGDAVRRGQVLARIDSTRFEAGSASPRRACRRRGRSGAGGGRPRGRPAWPTSAARMHADKLISDQAFEQAQAELKMKEAALDALRRRVQQQAAAVALKGRAGARCSPHFNRLQLLRRLH